jgi:hypothetical protein
MGKRYKDKDGAVYYFYYAIDEKWHCIKEKNAFCSVRPILDDDSGFDNDDDAQTALDAYAREHGLEEVLESQLAEATKPLRWRGPDELVPMDTTALFLAVDGRYGLYYNDDPCDRKLFRIDKWVPLGNGRLPLPLSELTGHHEVTK